MSFRLEQGAVRVDLNSGLVFRAASGAGTVSFTDSGIVGSYRLTAANGALGDDGAGGQIFGFTDDIERAEGGRGADVLLGRGGADVLIGGGGNDFIDGRGGQDLAVFARPASDFTVARTADGVAVSHAVPATALSPAEIERVLLTNIEFLQFADRRVVAVDVPVGVGSNAATLAKVNPAPLLADDEVTLPEDGAVTFSVTGNDLPGEFAPQPVHVTPISGQAIIAGGPAVVVDHGSVSLEADGRLSFAPAANFFGQTSFTYTAEDGGGVPGTAAVTLDITPEADAPTAVADSFDVALGFATHLDVLDNDINLDGPQSDLTIQALDLAGLAGVASTDGHTITFTCDTLGTTTFTYTAFNGLGSTPITVTINVVAEGNHTPTVTGDLAASLDEASTLTLTEDDIGASDADGDALTYLASGLVNGALLVDGSAASSFTLADVQAGLVAFRHDGSETTDAGFDLTVSDGDAAADPVKVHLTVTPVNDAPIVTGAAPSTYVANAAALAIAPALTISDLDSATLTGATVAITDAGPEDVLSFTTVVGISGAFADGVLVLSGTATVTDFVAGEDRIQLSAAAFQIGAAQANIWLSTSGTFTSTNQRIAYDAAPGVLSYDSNGSAGGGTRVRLGIIDMNDDTALHPVLTLGDFVLV